MSRRFKLSSLTRNLSPPESKNRDSRSGIALLNIWLADPPFKSQDISLKEETFYKIIEATAKLTPAELDKINSADLDQRKSMTLGKYVLKGFEMLSKQD